MYNGRDYRVVLVVLGDPDAKDECIRVADTINILPDGQLVGYSAAGNIIWAFAKYSWLYVELAGSQDS